MGRSACCKCSPAPPPPLAICAVLWPIRARFLPRTMSGCSRNQLAHSRELSCHRAEACDFVCLQAGHGNRQGATRASRPARTTTGGEFDAVLDRRTNFALGEAARCRQHRRGGGCSMSFMPSRWWCLMSFRWSEIYATCASTSSESRCSWAGRQDFRSRRTALRPRLDYGCTAGGATGSGR